jgi:hypothetical protein
MDDLAFLKGDAQKLSGDLGFNCHCRERNDRPEGVDGGVDIFDFDDCCCDSDRRGRPCGRRAL